jgi:ABC-type uncharacterized transport system permease subunit
MNATTIASIIAITLALNLSVLYATFAEIVGRRAGIVNLGIEGVMLIGAVCGFAGAVIRGFIIWGRVGAFTVPAGLREVFVVTAESE